MNAIIVSGAAGGIGRELVRSFQQARYRVFGVDLAEQPGGLACDAYLQCDLRRTVEDPAYAKETFDQLRGWLGGSPLKALVNNAATQVVSPMQSLSREDWRSTLDVNVVAPFIWAQAFLGELERACGTVLKISSSHVPVAMPGFIPSATIQPSLCGLTLA